LMFRLIVYLYDIHHEKTPPPLTWRLAYFFLLPNACFPLFPVVDFKKFRQTYYSEPAATVYQRGLSWIFRGIYQLVLYRIVYQFLVLPPGEVQSTLQLVQFMLSAYLLYLRVSGLFHLIVGLLLLFGFNIPETHKKYYLASSFNDFWRRINIYWKDFMMKIFYYPVYFKVKSLGPTAALVIATVAVFICTWALHAYQWFWIRGTLLFELHDLLFWGVLGALVVFNSLREIKHGRNRSSGRQPLLSLASFAHACRVIATFTSLCVLWSMWSSDNFEQWILMWRAAGPSSAAIVAVIPFFHFLAWLAEKRASRASVRKSGPAAALSTQRVRMPQQSGILQPWIRGAFTAATVFMLCGFVAATRPGATLVSSDLADSAQLVRSDHLNRRDQAHMERGYYEHLIDANRHSDGLMQVAEGKPANWDNLDDTTLALHPNTFILTELAPSQELVFKNSLMRTNRWGMRDQDYAKEKPVGTTRLAFLGTSHVMGTGVPDDQVFEQVLENRLNSESSGGRHYEILNFGMAAYSGLQQLYLLENKVGEFTPDVVVYFQMEDDDRFILRHLSMVIRGNIEIPYDYVRQIVSDLELTAASSDELIRQKLGPHADRIQEWAERRLMEKVQVIGATPVCVMLPKVQARPSRIASEKRQRVTAELGCKSISLVDVYKGFSEKDLEIASWDQHPNSLGHELIAAQLYEQLVGRPELLAQRTGSL